jgi:hypothetical protein
LVLVEQRVVETHLLLVQVLFSIPLLPQLVVEEVQELVEVTQILAVQQTTPV